MTLLGFWIKEKLYSEQPRINFQYRYIAVAEGDAGLYLASSYENVNQIFSNEYRPAVLNVRDFKRAQILR